MAGFSVAQTENLTRSNVWTAELKEQLLDDLIATKYVDWLTEFGDGDTWNMPSIGQAEVNDYAEGQALRYTAMDTGNFTFSVTEYKSTATYIYRKFMQDSFYMSKLVSSFVPKQRRALMKALEVDILRVLPEAQTSASVNSVNGADHRWVGAGTNETISPSDFAKASYALDKANVPRRGRIAIVDPSVEFALNTLTNLVNVSNNPRWEGIVESGISTGMSFIKNIYGFDVYVSQNLKSGIAETISGRTTTTAVANLFFSAEADVLPIVGAIRQQPIVDTKFNMDLQREEYATTMRYGVKAFRLENAVVVLTDTDQVS